MQKRTVLKSLLAGCFILALGAFVQVQAQTKVDATGTWKWTNPGRNGGADMTNTLVLKMEGDKLTGTLSRPGRQGAANETKIEDAKLTGDELSFAVSVERNGNKRTTKYNGKVAGDTIKGKAEFEGQNGPMSRDWEAKREKK